MRISKPVCKHTENRSYFSVWVKGNLIARKWLLHIVHKCRSYLLPAIRQWHVVLTMLKAKGLCKLSCWKLHVPNKSKMVWGVGVGATHIWFGQKIMPLNPDDWTCVPLYFTSQVEFAFHGILTSLTVYSSPSLLWPPSLLRNCGHIREVNFINLVISHDAVIAVISHVVATVS